jgi:hypothetical protein
VRAARQSWLHAKVPPRLRDASPSATRPLHSLLLCMSRAPPLKILRAVAAVPAAGQARARALQCGFLHEAT